MTEPNWTGNLRRILDECARAERCITYADLARAAGVPGPRSIRALTEALEAMIREDIIRGAPLRAALVISKSGSGLPRPGFFELCRDEGLYFGPETGPQAETFHQIELNRLFVNARSAPSPL